MHSGTSILHRIIRSSGKIFSPVKEINFFNYKRYNYRVKYKNLDSKRIRKDYIKQLVKDITSDKERNFIDIKTSFNKTHEELYINTLLQLSKSKGYNCVMDGTPNNLMFHLEITELVDSYWCFGIIRDPRDILSSKKRRKSKNKTHIKKDFSILWDSIAIRRYYKKLVKIARGDKNVLIIRYEDLTEKYNDMTNFIYKVTGLLINRNPNTYNFNNSDTVSTGGIFQNTNKFQQDLTPVEIWINQLLCKDILKTYDYPLSKISVNIKLQGLLVILKELIFPLGRLYNRFKYLGYSDFKSYLRIQYKRFI